MTVAGQHGYGPATSGLWLELAILGLCLEPVTLGSVEGHEGFDFEVLLDAAVAIEELLRGPKGSAVQLLGAFHEAEARTKFTVKGCSVVA